MAEAIGIVSGVLSIADLGARLSMKLYTYSHKAKDANKSLRAISSDVSLTCTVLKELGRTLEKDDQSRLYSHNAISTAETVVKECETVFADLDRILDGRIASNEASRTKTKFQEIAGKLKFPFLEPHLELLRCNLDRLKVTLLLMLNVIIYAGQVRRKENSAKLQEQDDLIKTIHEEKLANDARFEKLTKAIEDIKISEDVKAVGRKRRAAGFSTSSFSPFIQSNIMMSPSIFDDTASQAKASEDPVSEKTGTKHHEELQHYCAMVKALWVQIDSVQQKIDNRILETSRFVLSNAHEFSNRAVLCENHGHKAVQLAFDDLVPRHMYPKRYVDITTTQDDSAVSSSVGEERRWQILANAPITKRSAGASYHHARDASHGDIVSWDDAELWSMDSYTLEEAEVQVKTDIQERRDIQTSQGAQSGLRSQAYSASVPKVPEPKPSVPTIRGLSWPEQSQPHHQQEAQGSRSTLSSPDNPEIILLDQCHSESGSPDKDTEEAVVMLTSGQSLESSEVDHVTRLPESAVLTPKDAPWSSSIDLPIMGKEKTAIRKQESWPSPISRGRLRADRTSPTKPEDRPENETAGRERLMRPTNLKQQTTPFEHQSSIIDDRIHHFQQGTDRQQQATLSEKQQRLLAESIRQLKQSTGRDLSTEGKQRSIAVIRRSRERGEVVEQKDASSSGKAFRFADSDDQNKKKPPLFSTPQEYRSRARSPAITSAPGQQQQRNIRCSTGLIDVRSIPETEHLSVYESGEVVSQPAGRRARNTVYVRNSEHRPAPRQGGGYLFPSNPATESRRQRGGGQSHRYQQRPAQWPTQNDEPHRRQAKGDPLLERGGQQSRNQTKGFEPRAERLRPSLKGGNIPRSQSVNSRGNPRPSQLDDKDFTSPEPRRTSAQPSPRRLNTEPGTVVRNPVSSERSTISPIPAEKYNSQEYQPSRLVTELLSMWTTTATTAGS